MTRRHRVDIEGDVIYRRHGRRRWRGPHGVTRRQRQLCERHGHRLGHEMSYMGSTQQYGGDWHSTYESGRIRSCLRCKERFYFNVKMGQSSRPNARDWTEPMRQWESGGDEWKTAGGERGT